MPAAHFIPEDVRQFILEKVDSIIQLEGLLLLRAHPETEWRIEVLAERLYINDREASNLASYLCANGFAAKTGDTPPLYKYKPQSAELTNLIERTADTYSRYLIPVTSLVHDKLKNRILRFSEAFVVRKEPKDG